MTFREEIAAARATILSAVTRLSEALPHAPDESASNYCYFVSKKLQELADSEDAMSLNLLLVHLDTFG